MLRYRYVGRQPMAERVEQLRRYLTEQFQLSGLQITESVMEGPLLRFALVLDEMYVPLVLELTPAGKASVLLVVNAKGVQAESGIQAVVDKYAKRSRVQSRNVSKESLDLILDVKVTNEQALLTELMALSDVYGASLMAHDGEVTI